MSTPTLLNPKRWLRSAQNSLEAAVKPSEHDEAVLRQSTVWMRSITWALIGTTAFGVGWLALAQTEEIVQAGGKLEPIGSVKDIQMPMGGVARRILVKEGEQVKEGQPLLELNTDANAARRRALIESITLKQGQLELKQAELQRYLELNDKETEMLSNNLALDQRILESFATLNKEGATAELQYLQQKNRVAEVQGKLAQSQVDRLRQTAILEQAMKQLRTELQTLRSDLAETEQMLSYQTVKAPVSGVVFDLKPKVVGFSAQSTETVMKIVPFDKLEARVEVPSSDIGFVRTGMAADLSIDSFPATDFGVLEGTVRKIGSDALPPDQLKQRDTYRYPVDIRLASQQLKLKSGKSLPLQVGMSLTANIKLRKVTYLQLLLGSFRDKADALRQI